MTYDGASESTGDDGGNPEGTQEPEMDAAGEDETPEDGGGPDVPDAPDEPSTVAPDGEKIGGCVLPRPAEDAPADPRQVGGVVTDSAYAPFTKHLGVFGITLIAGDDVTDAFMEKVSETIQSIFADNVADPQTQRQILVNLHRYRAVIPLFKGEPDIDSLGGPAFDRLMDGHSICDIIMEDVDGQVMEVLEHILHIVTDVGLHHTLGEAWAMEEGSTLGQTLDQAIEQGIYGVSSYDDIPEQEVRFRVVIQEYAYWIITTGWDVQESYGPGRNEEWTIATPGELQEALPEAHALYLDSLAVMSPPREALLEALEAFAP